MIRTNIITLFFTLLIVLPASSLAQKPRGSTGSDSDRFLGRLQGGIYRNDFFKFSLKVPDDFFSLTKDEQTAAKNAGAKVLSEGVKGNQEAWERAAKAEVILVGILEKGPGSLENSSLLIGAVRQADGVSPRMVANASRDFILKNKDFRLLKDTVPTTLAKKGFAVVEFTATIREQTISTKYYVTIHRGHSLTFVITYFTKDALEEFEKILKTLTFDPQ